MTVVATFFHYCDISHQGPSEGYYLNSKAEADNPYLDLVYYGYHKHLIQPL